MSTPSEDRPPLRIGTQEREAAYAALNAHLEAGRLDAEEYGERYAKASVARTWLELEALFLDLPRPHPRHPDAPAGFSATPAPHSSHPDDRIYSTPSRGWRRQPGFGWAAMSLLSILPIIALLFFFASGGWLIFLLIPLIGSMARGRRGGRGHRGWAGGCGPRW